MADARPLPAWLEELRQRYLSGEASMFLLHGNVRDLYPWPEEAGDGAGEGRYVPLRELLERFLARTKDIVAYYNVSEGLEFPEPRMASRFRAVVNARRALRGEAGIDVLPRSPGEVLPLVEELITDPAQHAAAVLDYVEMIAPHGDLAFMSQADKANLVALQRWSTDPAIQHSDNLVILVSENLSDVHRRLLGSTQLATVRVPLPSLDERRAFLGTLGLEAAGVLGAGMDAEALARVTAGLSLAQLRAIVRRARQSGEPVTFRTVSLRKKEIIEQECHGLVEFVEPEHDFSQVGGMEGIKAVLRRVAAAIRAGHRNRVPMGILFVGPMGTGKTFVAEAFSAESGLTCLKLKNFREKWVGSTEGNLEKVLQVVEGLGYVLLIVDEADRSMSSGAEGDGGTNSRVIARLKEFMSDTAHRGRVVVLMMTNRPDKLDVDLKRPGRLDLKIPFFFPERPEEREAILWALVRKNDLPTASGLDLGSVAAATDGYSGAELEALLIAAANHAADEGRELLAAEDLDAALEDVIPSRDTRMLEYMELLAVFESSSRLMLPERYQDLPTEEVLNRLDAARALLAGRL